MLTLADLECQRSPLEVIYDVICDGLWYLQALQMTVPREGDATRPASISHAHMCRETEGRELLFTKHKHLPDFNTFRKFTGNQLKKKKKALAAGFTATIINRSMKTGKNTKHSIPMFWVRCKFPQKKVKRCFISPHCCNQSCHLKCLMTDKKINYY